MRREFCMIGGVPLVLDVPQDKAELEAGWPLKDPQTDGMLFDLRRFSRTCPLWVPIVVGGNAPVDALDVVWIGGGVVRAVATHRGGCLQSYADAVVELPAGSAERWSITTGSLVTFGEETLEEKGH